MLHGNRRTRPGEVRKPRRDARGGPHAFTLLELLVVIAIIAILASLALGAVINGRRKARSTQCLGNLHQWGLAYRMYADDNNDFLPRRGQGVQVLTVVDRPDDWFNALPPYFGSKTFEDLVAAGSRPAAHSDSVFICPAADDPGGTYFLPYGMNMNLSPWNLPLAAKFGSIGQSALVVAVADAPGPYASTYPSTKPYSPVPRHSGRVNLLFLGGQAISFDGPYVGCGVGDPGVNDVRWSTGTESDAQAHNY
jgi:prepilin-type N-terminal cleavage/methylation domain-containing protein/prepilin-type processing-associated H-X9-DG protein